MVLSTDEAHILSLIKSSDAGDVFSSVLRPLSGLSTCREEDRARAVRSIAKQFIPFLTKSVSFPQKRLAVTGPAHKSLGDLFRAYDLCLECSELISHKPHAVQLERLRLINCYQTWGWFTHAYNDAFRVLEQLRGPESSYSHFLPNSESGDAKLAGVLLELVASIVRSVAMSRHMGDHQYSRILLLLSEIKPWLRILDANAHEKLLKLLVLDVEKCALSMFREAERFDEGLLISFYISTLKAYSISTLPTSHFYKFSREVLSLLFVSKERKTSKTIEIMMSVLRTAACELQFEQENWEDLDLAEPDENWLELVDLVSYCAHKSQLAGNIWCLGVSKLLSEIAAVFYEAIPQLYVILRLYSAGLSDIVFDVEFREKSKETTENWGLQALLGDKDLLESLVSLLRFIDPCSDAKMTANDGKKKSKRQIYVPYIYKMDYTLPDLNAMKFLCQPLASLINFESNNMELETKFACYSVHLSVIHATFLNFCRDVLFLQRWTTDMEGSGVDFEKTLLNVAKAAFIISMRFHLKRQITTGVIEGVIASPLISLLELKDLSASFHDIALALYSTKHLASMAFELFMKTLWTCVRLLCQTFVNESNSSEDSLSGEAIIDFVSEACSKSAFSLDVLQQQDYENLPGAYEYEELVMYVLENWSAAEDLVPSLPDPTSVIKQWVEVQRRRHEGWSLADYRTTLYPMLLSSQKISKRVIRKIFEQELIAYEEILPLRSKLCRAEHTKIADFLLKDISKELVVERARIIIWKARMTRGSGTKHLKDCIQYLSEAISILGNVFHEPSNHRSLCCHQLAIAYCLRALCVQETEPDSKQIFQDVNTSLDLWLQIPPTPCDSKDSIPLENMIPLLYNVIDLLSIKGWIELYQHIYELIFRLFKWKNVKLELCLAMLWDCRRLSHALCPSPINDAVILGLSDYFGEKSESTDFWISCLQFSKAESIGFQLSMQSSPFESLHTSKKHDDPYKSDITIDIIISTASKLVSSDPSPSHSSFVAASLYYDLCERQLNVGNLYEALSYANEAHRIRHLMFIDKFSYAAESHTERHNIAGKTIEALTYSINKFEVSRATSLWPCSNSLWDINHCYLSPWNVLRCYLESIPQLGDINELIGEGNKAEDFLSLGKAISCMQNLQPFVVAFSLALGNLYKRMQSVDLAAEELQNAKELLIDSRRDFSCRNCRLMLEATLDKQLGDLSQRQYDNKPRVIQVDGLSHAESLFSAVLRNFCCSAWKGHVKEITEAREMCKIYLASQSRKSNLGGIKEKPTDNRDSKRRRRGGAINLQAKEHKLISEPSSRLTRSMSRLLKEQRQSSPPDMRISVSKKRSFSDESDLFDEKKALLLDTKNTICSICVCVNGICQCCLANEVTKSGLLNNLISSKWKFHQRKLVCTLLDSLGKSLVKSGKVHQAHEAILHSMAVLYNSNVSSLSSPSHTTLLDFIGKEIKGDVFGVDRARILYNLCKLTLQTYHSRASRFQGCLLLYTYFLLQVLSSHSHVMAS